MSRAKSARCYQMLSCQLVNRNVIRRTELTQGINRPTPEATQWSTMRVMRLLPGIYLASPLRSPLGACILKHPCSKLLTSYWSWSRKRNLRSRICGEGEKLGIQLSSLHCCEYPGLVPARLLCDLRNLGSSSRLCLSLHSLEYVYMKLNELESRPGHLRVKTHTRRAT